MSLSPRDLHTAILSGDEAFLNNIIRLIKTHIPPNELPKFLLTRWSTECGYAHSPLYLAVLNGVEFAVKGLCELFPEMVNKAIQLDYAQDLSISPLSKAIIDGNDRIAMILVEYGASIDLTDVNDPFVLEEHLSHILFPLLACVLTQNWSLLKWLVEYQGDSLDDNHRQFKSTPEDEKSPLAHQNNPPHSSQLKTSEVNLLTNTHSLSQDTHPISDFLIHFSSPIAANTTTQPEPPVPTPPAPTQTLDNNSHISHGTNNYKRRYGNLNNHSFPTTIVNLAAIIGGIDAVDFIFSLNQTKHSIKSPDRTTGPNSTDKTQTKTQFHPVDPNAVNVYGESILCEIMINWFSPESIMTMVRTGTIDSLLISSTNGDQFFHQNNGKNQPNIHHVGNPPQTILNLGDQHVMVQRIRHHYGVNPDPFYSTTTTTPTKSPIGSQYPLSLTWFERMNLILDYLIEKGSDLTQICYQFVPSTTPNAMPNTIHTNTSSILLNRTIQQSMFHPFSYSELPNQKRIGETTPEYFHPETVRDLQLKVPPSLPKQSPFVDFQTHIDPCHVIRAFKVYSGDNPNGSKNNQNASQSHSQVNSITTPASSDVQGDIGVTNNGLDSNKVRWDWREYDNPSVLLQTPQWFQNIVNTIILPYDAFKFNRSGENNAEKGTKYAKVRSIFFDLFSTDPSIRLFSPLTIWNDLVAKMVHYSGVCQLFEFITPFSIHRVIPRQITKFVTKTLQSISKILPDPVNFDHDDFAINLLPIQTHFSQTDLFYFIIMTNSYNLFPLLLYCLDVDQIPHQNPQIGVPEVQTSAKLYSFTTRLFNNWKKRKGDSTIIDLNLQNQRLNQKQLSTVPPLRQSRSGPQFVYNAPHIFPDIPNNQCSNLNNPNNQQKGPKNNKRKSVISPQDTTRQQTHIEHRDDDCPIITTSFYQASRYQLWTPGDLTALNVMIFQWSKNLTYTFPNHLFVSLAPRARFGNSKALGDFRLIYHWCLEQVARYRHAGIYDNYNIYSMYTNLFSGNWYGLYCLLLLAPVHIFKFLSNVNDDIFSIISRCYHHWSETMAHTLLYTESPVALRVINTLSVSPEPIFVDLVPFTSQNNKLVQNRTENTNININTHPSAPIRVSEDNTSNSNDTVTTTIFSDIIMADSPTPFLTHQLSPTNRLIELLQNGLLLPFLTPNKSHKHHTDDFTLMMTALFSDKQSGQKETKKNKKNSKTSLQNDPTDKKSLSLLDFQRGLNPFNGISTSIVNKTREKLLKKFSLRFPLTIHPEYNLDSEYYHKYQTRTLAYLFNQAQLGGMTSLFDPFFAENSISTIKLFQNSIFFSQQIQHPFSTIQSGNHSSRPISFGNIDYTTLIPQILPPAEPQSNSGPQHETINDLHRIDSNIYSLLQHKHALLHSFYNTLGPMSYSTPTQQNYFSISALKHLTTMFSSEPQPTIQTLTPTKDKILDELPQDCKNGEKNVLPVLSPLDPSSLLFHLNLLIHAPIDQIHEPTLTDKINSTSSQPRYNTTRQKMLHTSPIFHVILCEFLLPLLLSDASLTSISTSLTSYQLNTSQSLLLKYIVELDGYADEKSGQLSNPFQYLLFILYQVLYVSTKSNDVPLQIFIEACIVYCKQRNAVFSKQKGPKTRKVSQLSPPLPPNIPQNSFNSSTIDQTGDIPTQIVHEDCLILDNMLLIVPDLDYSPETVSDTHQDLIHAGVSKNKTSNGQSKGFDLPNSTQFDDFPTICAELSKISPIFGPTLETDSKSLINQQFDFLDKTIKAPALKPQNNTHIVPATFKRTPAQGQGGRGGNQTTANVIKSASFGSDIENSLIFSRESLNSINNSLNMSLFSTNPPKDDSTIKKPGINRHQLLLVLFGQKSYLLNNYSQQNSLILAYPAQLLKFLNYMQSLAFISKNVDEIVQMKQLLSYLFHADRVKVRIDIPTSIPLYPHHDLLNRSNYLGQFLSYFATKTGDFAHLSHFFDHNPNAPPNSRPIPKSSAAFDLSLPWIGDQSITDQMVLLQERLPKVLPLLDRNKLINSLFDVNSHIITFFVATSSNNLLTMTREYIEILNHFQLFDMIKWLAILVHLGVEPRHNTSHNHSKNHHNSSKLFSTLFSPIDNGNYNIQYPTTQQLLGFLWLQGYDIKRLDDIFSIIFHFLEQLHYLIYRSIYMSIASLSTIALPWLYAQWYEIAYLLEISDSLFMITHANILSTRTNMNKQDQSDQMGTIGSGNGNFNRIDGGLDQVGNNVNNAKYLFDQLIDSFPSDLIDIDPYSFIEQVSFPIGLNITDNHAKSRQICTIAENTDFEPHNGSSSEASWEKQNLPNGLWITQRRQILHVLNRYQFPMTYQSHTTINRELTTNPIRLKGKTTGSSGQNTKTAPKLPFEYQPLNQLSSDLIGIIPPPPPFPVTNRMKLYTSIPTTGLLKNLNNPPPSQTNTGAIPDPLTFLLHMSLPISSFKLIYPEPAILEPLMSRSQYLTVLSLYLSKSSVTPAQIQTSVSLHSKYTLGIYEAISQTNVCTSSSHPNQSLKRLAQPVSMLTSPGTQYLFLQSNCQFANDNLRDGMQLNEVELQVREGLQARMPAVVDQFDMFKLQRFVKQALVHYLPKHEQIDRQSSDVDNFSQKMLTFSQNHELNLHHSVSPNDYQENFTWCDPGSRIGPLDLSVYNFFSSTNKINSHITPQPLQPVDPTLPTAKRVPLSENDVVLPDTNDGTDYAHRVDNIRKWSTKFTPKWQGVQKPLKKAQIPPKNAVLFPTNPSNSADKPTIQPYFSQPSNSTWLTQNQSTNPLVPFATSVSVHSQRVLSIAHTLLTGTWDRTAKQYGILSKTGFLNIPSIFTRVRQREGQYVSKKFAMQNDNGGSDRGIDESSCTQVEVGDFIYDLYFYSHTQPNFIHNLIELLFITTSLGTATLIPDLYHNQHPRIGKAPEYPVIVSIYQLIVSLYSQQYQHKLKLLNYFNKDSDLLDLILFGHPFDAVAFEEHQYYHNLRTKLQQERINLKKSRQRLANSSQNGSPALQTAHINRELSVPVFYQLNTLTTRNNDSGFDGKAHTEGDNQGMGSTQALEPASSITLLNDNDIRKQQHKLFGAQNIRNYRILQKKVGQNKSTNPSFPADEIAQEREQKKQIFKLAQIQHMYTLIARFTHIQHIYEGSGSPPYSQQNLAQMYPPTPLSVFFNDITTGSSILSNPRVISTELFTNPHQCQLLQQIIFGFGGPVSFPVVSFDAKSVGMGTMSKMRPLSTHPLSTNSPNLGSTAVNYNGVISYDKDLLFIFDKNHCCQLSKTFDQKVDEKNGKNTTQTSIPQNCLSFHPMIKLNQTSPEGYSFISLLLQMYSSTPLTSQHRTYLIYLFRALCRPSQTNLTTLSHFYSRPYLHHYQTKSCPSSPTSDYALNLIQRRGLLPFPGLFEPLNLFIGYNYIPPALTVPLVPNHPAMFHYYIHQHMYYLGRSNIRKEVSFKVEMRSAALLGFDPDNGEVDDNNGQINDIQVPLRIKQTKLVSKYPWYDPNTDQINPRHPSFLFTLFTEVNMLTSTCSMYVNRKQTATQTKIPGSPRNNDNDDDSFKTQGDSDNTCSLEDLLPPSLKLMSDNAITVFLRLSSATMTKQDLVTLNNPLCLMLLHSQFGLLLSWVRNNPEAFQIDPVLSTLQYVQDYFDDGLFHDNDDDGDGVDSVGIVENIKLSTTTTTTTTTTSTTNIGHLSSPMNVSKKAQIKNRQKKNKKKRTNLVWDNGDTQQLSDQDLLSLFGLAVNNNNTNNSNQLDNTVTLESNDSSLDTSVLTPQLSRNQSKDGQISSNISSDGTPISKDDCEPLLIPSLGNTPSETQSGIKSIDGSRSGDGFNDTFSSSSLSQQTSNYTKRTQIKYQLPGLIGTNSISNTLGDDGVKNGGENISVVDSYHHVPMNELLNFSLSPSQPIDNPQLKLSYDFVYLLCVLLKLTRFKDILYGTMYYFGFDNVIAILNFLSMSFFPNLFNYKA